MFNALESPSLRPYLIRALHEWCTASGFTPFIAVFVDGTVQVPREYVHKDEIVLNVSVDATHGLKLGDEFIEFKARFGGVPRDIMVPVNRVMAVYARESGQGMAFPIEPVPAADGETAAPQTPKAGPGAPAPKGVQLVTAPVEDGKGGEPEPTPPGTSGRKRPALKRVK